MLSRFFTLGFNDADRRVAGALAPPTLGPADHYVKASVFVSGIDRATQRLQAWWLASEAGRSLAALREAISREAITARYQAIASVLLTAVIVHVALILMQGPRPGWFWLVIPAMAALFATLLLVGSRPSHPTN